jgi:hypothetical protein
MRYVRLAGAYTFYNGNIRRLVPTSWWFLSQIAKRLGIRATARSRRRRVPAFHAYRVPRHARRYHGDEVMHRVLAHAPRGRSRREFLSR